MVVYGIDESMNILNVWIFFDLITHVYHLLKLKKLNYFTWITGCTLAHIAVASRRLKTDSMFAIVLLARGRLRVQLIHHGFNLTKCAAEFWGAFAGVFVDTVHTSAAILKTIKKYFHSDLVNLVTYILRGRWFKVGGMCTYSVFWHRYVQRCTYYVQLLGTCKYTYAFL